MERINLLISDLDGTLLGNEQALEEFADWYSCARAKFRLVYSSGRFVNSVLESIASTMLPVPDAIIGGVGTQIYDVEASRLWSMWPPSVIEWNPYIVQTICESFSELRLQPEPVMSHHKVSFYGNDLSDSFMERLRSRLALGGQRTTIIYSSNRDLDVLPAESGKGSAAHYLARRWRISPERTCVAGDSGNDADMFGCGFRGIVVGNAAPEIRALDLPNVYQANGEYAAGVLEGIRYWNR